MNYTSINRNSPNTTELKMKGPRRQVTALVTWGVVSKIRTEIGFSGPHCLQGSFLSYHDFLSLFHRFFLSSEPFQQFEINKKRQKRPNLPSVIQLFSPPSELFSQPIFSLYILTSFQFSRDDAQVSKRNNNISILIFK